MILQAIRRKFLKDNDEVLRDGAKQTIILGQVLVSLVNLSPMNLSKYKKIWFAVMMAICIMHELSVFACVLTSIEDIDSFIKSISSLAIGLQMMTKASTFLYKADDFRYIIETIRHQFWPSNLTSRKIDDQIRKDSAKLSFVFWTQYVAGLMFLFMYVVIPMTKSTRQLPHSTWYPFDVYKTPTYEILFAIQSFLTVYVIPNVVCSYDFIFCSICGNLVAQFRLLGKTVKYVGSGKDEEIVALLGKIPGVKCGRVIGKEDEHERELLMICVKHHQKLLEISNQLNRIFGTGHLLQLLANVLGTCTTCYRLTTESSFNNLAFSISFYVAHVAELLMYSALSSELNHWSICLSVDAFQSFWYLKKYSEIRKCLSIMIMRSQRGVSMNAHGLFEFNYTTFMSVMRFTLSLYTFLSKMVK